MKIRALLAVVGSMLAAAGVLVAKPGDISDTVKEPSKMPAEPSKDNSPVSPLDFTLQKIGGGEMKLSELRGKVVMLVNVASRCGLTPQYEALQATYEKYKDQGFVVVGIPANNFGMQEPGTDAEIQEFCSTKYRVTFPMASKISVGGGDKHPLYKFLTEQETAKEFAGDVEWNFAKFLVDRNGNLMARFASKTKPGDPKVTEAVEKALAAEAAK